MLNLVHVDDPKAQEYGEFMHRQGQKFFDFGEKLLVKAACWLAAVGIYAGSASMQVFCSALPCALDRLHAHGSCCMLCSICPA